MLWQEGEDAAVRVLRLLYWLLLVPGSQLCLQVGRRVQVSAGVARTAAFYEVHAHGDQTVGRVRVHMVRRMREATVFSRAFAVAALKLPADLTAATGHEERHADTTELLTSSRSERLPAGGCDLAASKAGWCRTAPKLLSCSAVDMSPGNRVRGA